MAPPIFPTLSGMTYPIKRSPKWLTLHQEAISGQDNPIQQWTYPRWAYEVPFSFLRSDSVNQEWQALLAFYNLMAGSVGVFQFTDPNDNSVTDQGFGIGDGATTAFPLVRTMSSIIGPFNFVEPVYAPTISNIKIAGTPTSAYTLGTQGLVTFSSPPANGAQLTWSGTYNWLCRFDDDTEQFEQFLQNFWQLQVIKFTTIKTQSK